MVDELKTSEEWQKLCKIEIWDPDGWDRENFEFSWHEDLITKKEFEDRLMQSTCKISKDYRFGKDSMWKGE